MTSKEKGDVRSPREQSVRDFTAFKGFITRTKIPILKPVVSSSEGTPEQTETSVNHVQEQKTDK